MADLFLAALDQATRTIVARARGQLSATAPIPAVARPSDAIAHFYCCDANWALCGLDLNEFRAPETANRTAPSAPTSTRQIPLPSKVTGLVTARGTWAR
ncbi:hypothetical protein [Streptomyces sp. L-9-10]|uniref:hypothetical protein n=1 Tax=Streptomyces sp. L-9-10 TaxID=1478131 RepID=UPI00101BBD5F|nr:hypothetical protein [Streptomyces sp. L-9-10]